MENLSVAGIIELVLSHVTKLTILPDNEQIIQDGICYTAKHYTEIRIITRGDNSRVWFCYYPHHANGDYHFDEVPFTTGTFDELNTIRDTFTEIVNLLKD